MWLIAVTNELIVSVFDIANSAAVNIMFASFFFFFLPLCFYVTSVSLEKICNSGITGFQDMHIKSS